MVSYLFETEIPFREFAGTSWSDLLSWQESDLTILEGYYREKVNLTLNCIGKFVLPQNFKFLFRLACNRIVKRYKLVSLSTIYQGAEILGIYFGLKVLLPKFVIDRRTGRRRLEWPSLAQYYTGNVTEMMEGQEEDVKIKM